MVTAGCRARPRLSLGRILYLSWFAPRAFVGKCAREGAANLWLAARGRRAMEAAERRLPPVGAASPVAPAVYFLTGSAFWYQTAFCAYSLVKRVGQSLRVMVIDDGSLGRGHADELMRLLPGLDIAWAAATEEKLDAFLPFERFPALRRRRLCYPHLRKLTDVHVGSDGWKLVLDSDMLFHRSPQFVMDWLSAPDRPCHMVDVADAYGYSVALMTELAGAPIPPKVNVGLCGLRSDALDWERLEHWCEVMLAREGSHYLQEQAMVAMLMAGQQRAVAPPEQYIVRPTRAETEHPTAALHHYVDEAKAWYFRFGWRHLLG